MIINGIREYVSFSKKVCRENGRTAAYWDDILLASGTSWGVYFTKKNPRRKEGENRNNEKEEMVGMKEIARKE